MKKRNLWAMSLIGLALTACTQDEEINNVINQGNEDGALVTLKLDVAKQETKGSPGSTNQQPGTETENEIKNVTVVVKVGSTTKVVTKTGPEITSESDGSKSVTFTAPEGEAEFYVYANKGGEVYSPGWATTMTSTGDVSGYYGVSQGFFMSNKDGKAVEHTINEGTENNVNVNIERAAAKVTVESASTFTDTDFGGTMTAMSFALGNMVDKFYLLQQSPISVPSGVAYIPNPDKATSWTEVALGKTAEAGKEGTQDRKLFTGAYCMENIASDGEQDKTTYIKFQTTFTPGKALELQAKDGGNGYTVKSDLKTVSGPASTFYVVLEGEDNITSNYIMKSDLYDGDNAKQGITLTLARKDGKPVAEGTPADCYNVTGIEGITKISLAYENGKCYFGPIWFNMQSDKTSPVYRNDWYHLTVTSVKLPGSPHEPGDGGEIPLEPDVNVTVKATVLDWEWEPRNIELQ